MSCAPNGREGGKTSLWGKLSERTVQGKREGVGIAGSAYFSIREVSSATEWPKAGAAPY